MEKDSWQRMLKGHRCLEYHESNAVKELSVQLRNVLSNHICAAPCCIVLDSWCPYVAALIRLVLFFLLVSRILRRDVNRSKISHWNASISSHLFDVTFGDCYLHNRFGLSNVLTSNHYGLPLLNATDFRTALYSFKGFRASGHQTWESPDGAWEKSKSGDWSGYSL